MLLKPPTIILNNPVHNVAMLVSLSNFWIKWYVAI